MNDQKLHKEIQRIESTIGVLINENAQDLSEEELSRCFDTCVMPDYLKDCARQFRKYGISVEYLKGYPFEEGTLTALYIAMMATKNGIV